jgi:MFS family permease
MLSIKKLKSLRQDKENLASNNIDSNHTISKTSFLILIISALVQYYDYHLFGFVIAKLSVVFFPSKDAAQSLSKAYYIVFLSYLAKPLGSMILGRIGDSRGRSYALSLSLIIMSVSSLIVALLPSYEKAGMLSIYLLLLARMLTNGSVGPGTDGIRIFIFEHVHHKRKCLGEGLATSSCLVGSFVAAASAAFFSSSNLGPDAWRIAFLLGSFMSVIILLAKYFFPIEYKTHKNQERESLDAIVNFADIFKKHWALCLTSAIILGGIGSSYQFLTIFWGQYASSVLNLVSTEDVDYYRYVSIGLYIVASILAGTIADYTTKFLTIALALIALTASLCINIYSIINGQFNPTAYFLLGCALPFLVMPAFIIVKQAIPLSIRFRVYSLSHALGSIFIAGPTNFLSNKLYTNTQIVWMPLCYLICIILAMTFATLKLHSQSLALEEKV